MPGIYAMKLHMYWRAGIYAMKTVSCWKSATMIKCMSQEDNWGFCTGGMQWNQNRPGNSLAM